MTAFSSQVTWFIARGSGAVALVLLTVSFVLGIPTLLSWGSPGVPRMVVQLLHRNISLLVIVFLVIHVASSVLDTFVTIRWIEAVVPFVGSYRPIWMGLGAIAVDLLLALIITSLLRGLIGYRTWKLIHWTAYACWPIALVHGFGTGTDTRFGWMLALDAVCAAAVLLAIGWRLAVRPQADPRWRLAAAASLVAVPVALVAFLLLGPLRSGWGTTHHASSSLPSASTVP
jgi:sulfoxide reductase heme-binding subunit YedZ